MAEPFTPSSLPSILPVLPIRNAVLFPSISLPLVVGRGKSVKAVEKAESGDNLILVVTQKDLSAVDPNAADLYTVGTLCKLEGVTPTDAGNKQIVVTGLARYQVAEYRSDGHLTARGEPSGDSHTDDSIRNEALFYNLKELSREILELLPGATEPLIRLIERVDDSAYLSNICSAYLNLTLPQKQRLLETTLVEDRVELLLDLMRKEREVLTLQREIRDKMSERLNKAQREAILREQIRTIRNELGEEAGEESVDDITEKLAQAELSAEASSQAEEELKRLRSLPSASAEYHVIRSYLELLAALPWNRRSGSEIDLAKARRILDEDHYGLEKVKRRIVQFLAVAKLKKDLRGPILCLVGPPGVGKTSLGQSIARAMGRGFIRASLGGIRDEAEIRGHRRTYVGAMPGRIIQSLKRGGTKNPVMMLDEIDKLRSDFHGDPSAAMLEVLDPEQNKSFTDHYIDVPFDLSEVFFIATANMVDTIPPALRDRMETIEISGYTHSEKLQIARRYLVPKMLREHGLDPSWVELPDESLNLLISRYTREAGVRELERKIAELYRSVAEHIVETPPEERGKDAGQLLQKERVREILGPERYIHEDTQAALRPGVAMGLAWTPEGGDLLYIETSLVPGPGAGGKLVLTGSLGDVMKESAQIAITLARSMSRSRRLADHDIHIHVPSGATPKDGPSAGITLLVALTSLLLDQPIQADLAMTGEITLRGSVLPVGGIKEKILAAHRAGVKTVLIPKRNEQDLIEVPAEVRDQLKIRLIDSVEEALAAAFEDRDLRNVA